MDASLLLSGSCRVLFQVTSATLAAFIKPVVRGLGTLFSAPLVIIALSSSVCFNLVPVVFLSCYFEV